MRGVEAVIATVFEPPTLDALLDDLEGQGIPAHIIRGERTNHAWNHGLERVTSRFALILNDDIALRPSGWARRLLRHAMSGFSHVTVPLPEQRSAGLVRSLRVPPSKGHAFLMDMAVKVPPIPEDLQVFHGDDWLYWQHRAHGRCCTAMDVEVVTQQGFSVKHPKLAEFLGCEPWEQARDDHEAARRYFVLPNDPQLRTEGGAAGPLLRDARGHQGGSTCEPALQRHRDALPAAPH